MPVIRSQIFTERTLHVYLKKNFGYINRSAKEVLNLKFIGDWLLNNGPSAVLKNVIFNDLMLCGQAVYFRVPALRRAFLRALKRANHVMLDVLGRIGFLIYKRERHVGAHEEFDRAVRGRFFHLFMYLGDKKTHQLLGAKELVLALSEYISSPDPDVPADSEAAILLPILTHYAANTSSSSVVTLLSKICQLGLVKLMRFVVEHGLPKVDGLHAKARLLWQHNALKLKTLLQSMVLSGVPIDRCQKMYLLLTLDGTECHNAQIGKMSMHIKSISKWDMYVACSRHSIKLLETLHNLHHSHNSCCKVTSARMTTCPDAVSWKIHSEFILTGALYHPKDAVSRQITAELSTISFFKHLEARGWTFTRQILRNAIHCDCLPVVKYLLVVWLAPITTTLSHRSSIPYEVDMWKEYLLIAIKENSLRCARYLLSLRRFISYKMLHDVEVALVDFNVHASMSVLLYETKASLGKPALRPNHLTREFGTLMKSGNVTKNCIICFENINDLNVFVLPCGHSFHNTCIARCPKSQCPTCRVNYEREYAN
jgi:hypothetical protein